MVSELLASSPALPPDVVAVAWSPTWAPLVYFVALVVVLSFRPQGLFGRTAARAQ